MRETIEIVENGSGYSILHSDGRYECEGTNDYDPKTAIVFKDYISVSAYIEKSWPAYSVWKGKWTSNTTYSIESDCVE